MDWVKDNTNLEVEALFPDGTTRQELVYELREAQPERSAEKTKLSWEIFDHY